ncbi:MAG: flagellar hook-basal body complex protein FliE [Bryobacteraceae bacterium]
MAVPILPSSIAPITPPAISTPPVGAGAPSGAFQSVFNDALSRVEQFQQNAHASVDRFLSGEDEEIHHVALETQKADLSFQLFLQVRNKIVDAYQEVMKLQV